MFKRVIVVVMDSVGIGQLPDAHQYGDFDVNTLGNIARLQGGLYLPNLEKMGLGHIADIKGVLPVAEPIASYGKMAEMSRGKDTITGHWELAGVPLFEPFPVYPNGFPQAVIKKFIECTNVQDILGNKVASGTAIIEELGQLHMETGYPIVYTSADSVFQIAAHEEIIPLDLLYKYCEIARNKVLVGKHRVGRVIARPFIGEKGNFRRTSNRHDYSVEPPSATILDLAKNNKLAVVSIGKIADIFSHRGITQAFSTKSNSHGLDTIRSVVREMDDCGIIMANLVDFDSLYGHRNDVSGYAQALEELDRGITSIMELLKTDDLLILTADHGCDPTTPGTDHTREYVPLLVYSKKSCCVDLGVRSTFADVAATIAENFKLQGLNYGQSFLSQILR